MTAPAWGLVAAAGSLHGGSLLPKTLLGNAPAPRAMPAPFAFDLGEAQGDGSHRLYQDPWGQGRGPAPNPLLPPASKGGTPAGAAPAPFPQCGSQAETLDPDKPV